MRKIFPGNEKKAGVTGDSLLSAAMTALVDEPVTARLSFNNIKDFSLATMREGCVQINLNVVSMEDLEEAYEHPETPEAQDIVVKVTGYSAHFVVLGKMLQKEFIERVNYDRL